MARLTDKDRELILADYHTGHYTVRELAAKHSIGKTTIAKICKDIIPKNRDKVDTLITLHTELSEQSGQEVDSVKEIVDKKTEHLKLINDNATLLAKKITKLANDPKAKSHDIRTLVEANDKLAVTLKVADRHAPKTEINNNNANVQTENFQALLQKVSD